MNVSISHSSPCSAVSLTFRRDSAGDVEVPDLGSGSSPGFGSHPGFGTGTGPGSSSSPSPGFCSSTGTGPGLSLSPGLGLTGLAFDTGLGQDLESPLSRQSPGALVSAAISAGPTPLKTSSSKKRKKVVTPTKDMKRVKSDDDEMTYNADLTQQVCAYHNLKNDISSLEKIILKAKLKTHSVKCSLVQLGVDEALLDVDEDDFNFGIVSFRSLDESKKVNKGAKVDEGATADKGRQVEVVENVDEIRPNEGDNLDESVTVITPNPEFISPEPKVKQEKVDTDDDVIVIDTDEDDLNFDFNPMQGKKTKTVKVKKERSEKSESVKVKPSKEKSESVKVQASTSTSTKVVEEDDDDGDDEDSKIPVIKVSDKFLCPQNCRKLFTTKYNMRKHVKKNICTKPLEERTPLRCCIEGCKHACYTEGAMRAHCLSHFDVKEHLCTICGKTFVYASSLTNHAQSHKTKDKDKDTSSMKVKSSASTSSTHSKKKKHKKHKKQVSFSSTDDED